MSIKIIPIPKKFIAYYTGSKVKLSSSTCQKIEKHWNELINQGKSFTRGEVFCISSIFLSKQHCVLFLDLSDYAHYLYTIHKKPNEEACKVLFTAALIETADQFYVLGKMADNTANPGRIQCPGGGLTKLHLEKNIFNLEKNICDECEEEIGLSLHSDIVTSFHKRYFISSKLHPYSAVIWKVKVQQTAEQFHQHFLHYRQQLLTIGKQPEFESLQFIAKSTQQIDHFFKNDPHPKANYIEKLLKTDCTIS